MSMFKTKSPEEKQAAQDKKVEKAQGALTKEVEKCLGIAQSWGVDVAGAVFACRSSDLDGGMKMPVIVIHPDRVVKYQKRMMGVNAETIPFKNISSVELTAGLIPRVKIYATGNTMDFPTGTAKGFVDTLHSLMDGSTSAPSAPASDPIEQLERLGSLLEKGLLTQEEFDKKKADLLA
jgi:hypothetical protein